MLKFTKKINEFNKIKKITTSLRLLIHLASSISAAALVCALAELVHQPSTIVHVLLFVFIFLLTVIGFRTRNKKISPAAVLLTLDEEHRNLAPAPYTLTTDDTSYTTWHTPLSLLRQRIMRTEMTRLRGASWRMTVLLFFCLALFWVGGIQPVIPGLSGPPAAVLTVLPQGDIYTLSDDERPRIVLADKNLIQIEVFAMTRDRNPTLQLKAGGDNYQEIQFQRHANGYLVTVRIDRTSDLHIPEIASESPLAHLVVEQSPAPQVTLTSITKIQNPYPDELILEMRIRVAAKSPLTAIKLLITTGGGTYEELVNTVIAPDKLDLVTTYSIVPESYMDSDLGKIELVATARDDRDRVGYSDPLVLNTISAYGRYRRVLETLKEVKRGLDEQVTDASDTDIQALRSLLAKAVIAADNSPFFDAIDRFTLSRLESELGQIKPELVAVLERLNAFLFEHEILDDRERDRDFFVTARHLAWVLKTAEKKKIAAFIAKINSFLDARRERWQLRVSVLPVSHKPAGWPQVRDTKPFKTALQRILDTYAEAQTSSQAAQDILAETVGAYKEWITELEAGEDAYRQELREKTREAITAAQNKLKKMQKRQGAISGYLDRALHRDKTELATGWPTQRMKQNTNLKEAKKLAASLANVTPVAAARLQGAIKAMQETVTHGNAEEFTVAESHSDLASRLLRHTQQATRNRSRMQRGRRRRTAGDRYYGQPIVGGTIELRRDYKVNKKYREDILEEIRDSKLLEKHGDLLDSYLRRIIR